MSRTNPVRGIGSNQFADKPPTAPRQPTADAANMAAMTTDDPFADPTDADDRPAKDRVGDDLSTLRDDLADDGIRLVAYPKGDGTVDLGIIEVAEEQRGTGRARAAMQQVCDVADRHDVRVELTPTDEFGASKSRLVKFYKQFGFVENKGSNKDFSTRAGMYRDPT